MKNYKIYENNKVNDNVIDELMKDVLSHYKNKKLITFTTDDGVSVMKLPKLEQNEVICASDFGMIKELLTEEQKSKLEVSVFMSSILFAEIRKKPFIVTNNSEKLYYLSNGLRDINLNDYEISPKIQEKIMRSFDANLGVLKTQFSILKDPSIEAKIETTKGLLRKFGSCKIEDNIKVSNSNEYEVFESKDEKPEKNEIVELNKEVKELKSEIEELKLMIKELRSSMSPKVSKTKKPKND